MTRVGIVAGSTRPGRKASAVAKWVAEVAQRHPAVVSGAAEVDVVDIADAGLPLLDEPVPPAFGVYQNEHTRRWAATVASYDAFVFVTPEYNHSLPGALKNAVDFLFAEWQFKPAAFVSYGLHGGVRAVEHLKLVLVEVKAVPVASQVALSVFEDFAYEDPTDPTSQGTVAAREHQDPALTESLDELLALAGALAPLRDQASVQDAAA